MSISLVSDIWNLVNELIPDEDRPELARELVGILIDHDFDLDDVEHEMGTDADIKSAVSYYADDQVDYDEDQEYQDDEEADSEDW